LVTRSAWVVDIEHATPFVGTDYCRFDDRLTRWTIRTLLERENCLAIVCWSDACRSAFLAKSLSGRLAQKTHVVYPAIDADLVAPRWTVRRDMRKLLFVFNKPQHNFFIKSGLEVVEAFKLARHHVASLELHIVGPVPVEVRGRLEGVAGLKLYGRVEPSELAGIYAACDLLVLPTVTDTFGMAFLEAFASGMPALAVRWFATPEIVRDGVNGVLIAKPEGLVSWMDAAGSPTMHSRDFIRARSSAEADRDTSTLLADQIVRLAGDPALVSHLSEEASRTVREGAFSPSAARRRLDEVAREVKARADAYATARRPKGPRSHASSANSVQTRK
jgi:glycosyltransferase involved in cell wall biosynthesis